MPMDGEVKTCRIDHSLLRIPAAVVDIYAHVFEWGPKALCHLPFTIYHLPFTICQVTLAIVSRVERELARLTQFPAKTETWWVKLVSGCSHARELVGQLCACKSPRMVRGGNRAETHRAIT